MTIKRILLVGGNTGGHVYPLFAVAESLGEAASQSSIEIDIRFMGDGDILKQEAQKLGLKSYQILNSKWRRYLSLKNFIDIFKLPIGIIQTLFFLWLYMPDIIFSKGGYASLLPCLIGRLYLIPIFIHESDAVPGITNKFLSHFAKKVYLALTVAAKYFMPDKTEVVGCPVRKKILQGDRIQAYTFFKLDPNKPTVLVTGASQGAKIVNDVLLLSLVELSKKFQVIHQTGLRNFDNVNGQITKLLAEGKNTYAEGLKNNYRIYPVFDVEQMALGYAAADVIISRSGSQIFESAAVGKPSIVIPLKNSGQDHQRANAREFAKFGAIVIEEDNLTPHILINEIEKAYDQRQSLSEKVRVFANLNSADIIANQLLNT